MSYNYQENPNSLYKDKRFLQSRSNTRFNDRNLLDIQIKRGLINSNLDRIDIERDEFMKNSLLEDNSEDNNEHNNEHNENGRIMSSRHDTNLERGMPFRPTVIIRKNIHEQNIHPEYLLRESREPVRTMNPFDPHTSRPGFADINMDTRLTSSTKVETLCSDNINSLSMFFVKNLFKILVSPFVVSSIDIYRIFAAIYIGSKGNTEIELKNYFEFPRRELLLENFSQILNNLESNEINIKSGSCILFNQELSINPQFCKYIDILTKVRKINLNSISNEITSVNDIISQITHPHMKKSITSQNLENLNVLLMTYSFINPTLLINEYQLGKGNFFSVFSGNSVVNYVLVKNQSFGFAQHDKIEILEICCEQNELMYGMIKLDQMEQLEINLKKIDLMNTINKLKPVYFKSVQFPLFNIQTKLKLKNVLKKSDLQTVFLDLNCPELFSDETKLDEVLQNSEIKIESKFKKIKLQNSYKSEKTYILNTSFIYYLRLRKTNTFVSIGIF
jgi:serine protease inhibitor